MISYADYLVLGFYFIVIFAIGALYKDKNKNPDDYFRSGGSMAWWMVGASCFMQKFSAWTFTGAASKAYVDGILIATIFFANAFGYLLNFLWTGHRFRRLRVVTAIEAIRERFGKSNEHFFTWITLPMGILVAGIWLNAIGVFISAVFGFNIMTTIIGVGCLVVFISVSGGSWAVIASDFVQMIILMLVAISVFALTLFHSDLGGLSGFFERVPDHHFNPSLVTDSSIVYLWMIAISIQTVIGLNTVMEASKFLCVKNEKNARKASLLAMILMFIGPIIWFFPPMAASYILPDLASQFPTLKNPEEASYIAIGMHVLPSGMLGLLISGIFAATMSSMDSGLNRNAGFFIKNFYEPYIYSGKSNQHLLNVSKVVTLIFGILVIMIGLMLAKLKSLSLFDLMMQFSSLIALPTMIPLFLAMIVRKTPSFSAWSTTLIGFFISFVIKFYFDPIWFCKLLNIKTTLSTSAEKDVILITIILLNIIVCTSWFLFTKRFYKHSGKHTKKAINNFYEKMETPLDEENAVSMSENGKDNTMGNICIVYAVLLGFMILIPNPIQGRIAFFTCSIILFSIGFLLRKSTRRISGP